MILVREKCRTNLPREPNKRHLQNRARFNRAEDLRLERKSRYPRTMYSLPFFLVCVFSLCLSMMDHRREFCNEIKFCQKHFCRKQENKARGYSLTARGKNVRGISNKNFPN